MELVSGVGIGILGTKLIIPNKPTLDLNLSIITAFLTVMLFALIGIGIPGFIHSRLIDRNKLFGLGIGKATLGLGIGLVLAGILSTLTYGFLPYAFSSFIIPVLVPILFGVIGFNKGIKTFANTV
ncbi:hypothetical protein GCM10023330_29870 [Litoribaculum gwangyangense]|uniref:Uncharacterized protein n=1 Tax=Litoribaculum gwangyangense TaxID=1130722 RepID=A0ABP9CUC9_9FLAO